MQSTYFSFWCSVTLYSGRLPEEGGLWMKYCMPGILLLAEAQGVGVGESDKEDQFFTHPFVVWGVRVVDSQLTILIWQLHSAFNV